MGILLLIFVFMVVGFVLQNHIIDIVDKPTVGSNLAQFKFSVASPRGANQKMVQHDTG